MRDPAWTKFERADDIAGMDDVIFVNSRYQVNLRYPGAYEVFGNVAHLSVKRRDKQPIRNWRDLQRIKNEICGEGMEAVEIFPAEKRLVDSANQYHLWVFESYRLPFGFRDRLVSEQVIGGTRQEPFEQKPHDLGSRDGETERTMTTIKTKMGLEQARGIGRRGVQ